MLSFRLHGGRLWLLWYIACATGACATSSSRGAAEFSDGADAYSLGAAPDHFYSRNNQRIRYREIGRGSPVVLLHGRAGTLSIWTFLADSLARQFRVIAIDQRGHGQSDKPGSPDLYGPEMARDVVALLDHLRIPRAHIVGHSLGALVGAYLAVNHPRRITTASFLAGPFYPDSASAAKAAAPYISDMESGEGWRRILRGQGMSDSAATVESARMLTTDTHAALIAMTRSMPNLAIAPQRASTITVPALVAVGTADDLLANSRQLASWWPRARLLEVPSVGHRQIVRDPQVLAAIRDLLRTSGR